jgi:DNA polymerase-3 subunit gamma/tau
VEYLVLARKFRPQVFEDVLGQEAVVRTLKNAIAQGRIAHAFLFSGPRGVGKTSIARILAKAINCQSGPTPTPCNDCTHCTEITDGIAMDVREIDGASNRGIDEIRELRENVKFAPVSSRYTVYIIDEIHMLTREAFNALLKTLEEPPGHVIFIFATTETHKVPATILSRCQCFEFRRIPLKAISESLRAIAVREGIRISDTGLAWIAEAGDGSLRDSQSIFDQVISYGGQAIEDAAVEEILGRTDRRFLLTLSAAVLARDAAACLRIIDEAYYAGLDMRTFYQTLLGHFRNLLLTAIAGGEASLLELPAEEIEKLKGQAEGASRDTLQRLLEILMSEEEAVRRSTNPRLNLEAVLCRMAYLEPLIPIETVLARMEGLERRLSGTAGSGPPPAPGTPAAPAAGNRSGGGAGPGTARAAGAPRTAATAAATAAEPPAVQLRQQPAAAPPAAVPAAARPPRAEGERAPGGGAPSGNPAAQWTAFKAFVQRQDPILCSKIEPAQCLHCSEGALKIGLPQDYLFLDDVTARKADLADLGRQFFLRETVLEIARLAPEANGGPNGGAPGNGNGRMARNLRNQEIRREALSHPLVRKVLDVFPGAEVRDVKVIEAAPPPPGAVRATPPPEEAELQETEEPPPPEPEENDDD